MSVQSTYDKEVVANIMKEQLTTYHYYISEYDRECYLHVLQQFTSKEDFFEFCDKWNLYLD